MTAHEFRDSLGILGLTQREFCERLGVDENTVGRWARGKVPVPRYVEYVLELLRQLEAHRPGR
jgi:transcriptional regulator with XRE-family HTH domain